MRSIKQLALVGVLSVATSIRAAEPPAGTAPQPEARPVAAGTVVEPGTTPSVGTNAVPGVAAAEGVAAPGNSEAGTNMVRMNFRGASLDMVLNYLTEAAGFIINIKPGTSVRGKVDVWSNDPLTREEALNLLDTVLNQNNLAAIRNGRTLTIVNRDEAKTQNIPVNQGSDPDKIPMTDKIVTQIMPVRFVEVGQLVKDLQPLVSMQTTMTANEAGNAIVMTDTQANIHRVAEVVHAIDMGAEEFTEVRVFHLDNSDPTEIADEISNLFPDDSRQGNSQSPMAMNPFFSRLAGRFGGGGFGGPGGPGGGAASTGGANNQNQRIKKRNRVIAVADQRTTSIIVSASRDLMDQIEAVVKQLDESKQGKQGVYVFELHHATPAEVLPPLQDSFGGNNGQNNRTTSTTQNDPLQSRSTTQNQQNNATSRTSSSSRGVGGGGGGGGSTFP